MKGDERLESRHDTIPIGRPAHVEASLVIHMPDYRFGALTIQVCFFLYIFFFFWGGRHEGEFPLG